MAVIDVTPAAVSIGPIRGRHVPGAAHFRLFSGETLGLLAAEVSVATVARARLARTLCICVCCVPARRIGRDGNRRTVQRCHAPLTWLAQEFGLCEENLK